MCYWLSLKKLALALLLPGILRKHFRKLFLGKFQMYTKVERQLERIPHVPPTSLTSYELTASLVSSLWPRTYSFGKDLRLFYP